MAGLDALWPVLVANATQALVLNAPSSPPSSWPPAPVYVAGPSGVEKGLMLRIGSGEFYGNGASNVETPVAHGLGVAPDFVIAMPALAAPGGTFWSGELGQYQAADETAFYMGAVAGAIPGSNPTELYTFGSEYTYYFNWLACVLLT